MNRDIFLEQEWLWPVLFCAVLLGFVFLWKEFRQTDRKWLILRMLLSLMAVFSLVMLLLQPIIEVIVQNRKAVILTENYNSTQLDSLVATSENITVINYIKDGLDSKQIDAITTAYILGNGLESYDFWPLAHISTKYLPSITDDGINRLKYDPKIQLGDSLKILGLYSKPKAGTKILLEDPSGTKLDSITLKKDTAVSFTLKALPKVEGLYKYSLLVTDSLGHKISSDVLPLEVAPQSGLRILILNTFPSFETKYLKNFLSRNKHEVLVRSKISKNTYKFENYNRLQTSIYNLTSDNLSDFDLIIMDGESYSSLSESSRRVLIERVEQYGLGIFIQPDANFLSRRDALGFRFKRNNRKNTQLTRWSKVTIPMAPYKFDQTEALTAILTSDDGVLSAYDYRGFGRIGTSIIAETYPLILKGDSDVYDYIWTRILEALSQNRNSVARWGTEEMPIYVDEPFHFNFTTTLKEPKVYDPLQGNIALRQKLYLPEQWSGVLYPKKNGWHKLEIERDSTSALNYYVHSRDEFQGLRRYQLQKANEQQFNTRDEVVQKVKSLKPISRLWFFSVFIIVLGVLWLLPRL